MISPNRLTAEEFAARVVEDDFEQQRSELVDGRVIEVERPDLAHGAIVLNLTKAIAQYLQRTPSENGYACFEIGLLVARDPDTVRRPAVSFFVGGQRFAELDRAITQTRPAWVVEIASTNARRADMRQRVEAYLNWGVRTVWVIDTVDVGVHVIQAGQATRLYTSSQTVPVQPVLADFGVAVKELFAMPK